MYSQDKFAIALNTTGSTSGYSWDNNTYYGAGLVLFNGRSGSFASWPVWTGFDAHSTYQPSAPTGVWTFVRPNKYEPGRAHIVVYDWDLSSSVTVDVSAALAELATKSATRKTTSALRSQRVSMRAARSASP